MIRIQHRMKNVFVFFNFRRSFSRHLNRVPLDAFPARTALKKMKPHYLHIPTTESLALTNLMSFRRSFFFAMERTFTMNSGRDGPARFLSTSENLQFADRSLSIQNQFYSLRLPTMIHLLDLPNGDPTMNQSLQTSKASSYHVNQCTMRQAKGCWRDTIHFDTNTASFESNPV